MPGASNIRAGGAFVEITADSRKLDAGLAAAEAKVRSYNARISQLQRQAQAAQNARTKVATEAAGEFSRAGGFRAAARRSDTDVAAADLEAKATESIRRGKALRAEAQAQAARAMSLSTAAARLEERRATLAESTAARAALTVRARAYKGDTAELQERLFSATHSAKDVALRENDKYFAVLRTRYAGNAKMLTRIEATAQAERARIVEQFDPGGPRILGRGGLLRRGARMMGGGMASAISPEVGMASYLMEGAGKFALPIGVAVGALAVLVAGFKAASDIVNETKAAMKELAKEFDATADTIKGARRLMSVETGGEAAQDQQDALNKRLEEVRGRDTDKTGFWNGLWSGGWLPGVKSTGRINTEIAQAQQQGEIRGLEGTVKDVKAFKARSVEAYAAVKAAKEQSAVEEARISAMNEGRAKEIAALRQKQALERTEAEQANKVKPGSVNMTTLDDRQYWERAALARRFRDEDRQDQRTADEARITATEQGFTHEMDLLRLKHRQEREDYDRAGRDKTVLIQRQADEEKARIVEQAEKVQDIIRGLQQGGQTAIGGTAAARAWEWLNLDKQLRDMGVLEDKIRQIHTLFAWKNRAEDWRAMSDLIEEMALRIEVATGQTSDWDAETMKLVKNLRRDRPDLTAGEVRNAADWQRAATLSEFARQEVESIRSPQSKLDEYAGRLAAAMAGGYLSQVQVDLLMRNRRAELLGQRIEAAGTFNGSALWGLAAGGPVNRIAAATEETAKNTRKLADKSRSGGLIFQ